MAEQTLGELRTRWSVAVRTAALRGRMAANVPFMAFEVHDEGVVVRADPGPLSKVRHYVTMVLQPLARPIPFILGDRVGRQSPDVWTMPWDGIARATRLTRWGIMLETVHGPARSFRFRSTRGVRAALGELRVHGVTVVDPRHRP